MNIPITSTLLAKREKEMLNVIEAEVRLILESSTRLGIKRQPAQPQPYPEVLEATT